MKRKKYSMVLEYYGKPRNHKQIDEATPQQQVGFIPSLVRLGNKLSATDLTKINNEINQLLTGNVLPLDFENKIKVINSELVKAGADQASANEVVKDVVSSYKEKIQKAGAALLQAPKKQVVAPPAFLSQPTKELEMPSPDDISVLKQSLINLNQEMLPAKKQAEIKQNIYEDIAKIGEQKLANYLFRALKNNKADPFANYYANAFKQVFGKNIEDVADKRTMAAQAIQTWQAKLKEEEEIDSVNEDSDEE